MYRRNLATIAAAAGVMLSVSAIVVPAFAKSGPKSAPTGACSVAGNVVTATNLPAGQVINFQFTDSTGTYGWVLGFTDTGTWSVTVPSTSGTTTYQFISATWGPNGSKYDVFASCSS